MSDYKYGNWYCVPSTTNEAAEIVELATQSGADNQMKCEGDSIVPYGVVDGVFGMGRFGGARYTIHQLREKFGSPANQWNGEGLPPVGAICELTNDADYFIEYMSDAIGNKVKVLSIFDMGGLSMAAVEYDGLCGCFRTDMLKPLRTKRDEWIERAEQMYSKYGVAGIYDAGLAKDIDE